MRSFNLAVIPGLLSLAIPLLLACQQPIEMPESERDLGAVATATIMTEESETLGTVTLTQGPQGVLVSADLNGLPPGGHGFHIHSVGSCSPDFSAAGGHFDPGGESHGFMHSTGMHAGDLPNIYANAAGAARAEAFTAAVTLAADDERSLFDSDGSAIVVHEKPDAYGEDVGSAGARIACGVIERS